MERLGLDGDVRRRLWAAGFGGVDAAFRYSAVEFELFALSTHADLELDGDDSDRHYANFLAWSDTIFVGVNEAIRTAASSSIKARWETVANDPLRRVMRQARHEALKGRREVVGWEFWADLGDAGYVLQQRLRGDDSDVFPLLGRSEDYLVWIRDEIFPLLFLAIDAGAHPQDDRTAADMPYPRVQTWTPSSSLDVRSLVD